LTRGIFISESMASARNAKKVPVPFSTGSGWGDVAAQTDLHRLGARPIPLTGIIGCIHTKTDGPADHPKLSCSNSISYFRRTKVPKREILRW
jgi:hypothetical protein